MDSNGTNMFMPVTPANGGGFGFGGGFNNAGAGFVGADVQRGFDQSAVMTGIGGVQNATTAGFGDLQTALCGGFAGVNAAIANGFAQAEIGENARQMSSMQQMFSLQSQLSQCCCDNRMATVQTQNIVQTEGSATRAAILEQTNAILSKLCDQEIETLRAANVTLQNQLNMANLAASQTAQTQQIISALTPAA